MSERLDSWKDIAAYVGRNVRTVQRWALTRGLPVHRLPSAGRRPRVFSTKSEVDDWLRPAARVRPAHLASVAVLPFLNLTGASEEQYFGDGLADDIITALVRVPGLRVTARTSSFAFRGRDGDVRQIGASLGAEWIIEGSVRRERSRVRVTAQLVSTSDGYHAWSERYDREATDLFEIQDDIARSIVAALAVALSAAPALPPTANLQAYDFWLKGRSVSRQLTLPAFAQARDCFERAVALDPRFGRAYFGLAELLFYGVVYGLTDSRDDARRARDAIARSLELDDAFGDAHALAGVFRGTLDYDWAAAEEEFRRAFELSPGSSSVMILHAWYHLVPRRRLAEAVREAEEAVALDPLSPRVRAWFGLVLVAARQYARAVAESREAVRLAPGLWWVRWYHATALILQGQTTQALREAGKVCAQIHKPIPVGAMALMYRLGRRREKAKRLLAELQEMSRTVFVPPAAFALAYLGTGDDRAFEWLDKAIDARDPIVKDLASMPMYDVIRDDPRFPGLLSRMHLA